VDAGVAVVVRRERPGDPVAEVHGAAFRREGNDPPVEVALLERLRSDAGWLPHLSLSATVGGEVAGHVVVTRAWVGGAPALGLGPIGVLPAYQRRGLGTALMHAVLGAAEARDETLVGLLGDPAYYGRFGFVPAVDLGVESPDPAWGGYFQARVLGDPAPRGRFRYAAPFDELA
jgi:putative acetyltransferase